MMDPELQQALACWVHQNLSEDAEDHLAQRMDADPELAALGKALRQSQARAAEVLAQPSLAPRPAPRHPSGPTRSTRSTGSPAAPPPQRGTAPGRNALFVAIFAGVAALLLGAFVLSSLLTADPVPAPPPLDAQLALVTDGSLAPLAVSEPHLATRSLITLGVPDVAATPPDLSALGFEFIDATALPGSIPGAAFRYRHGAREYLVQTAARMTPPTGAESRVVHGVTVYRSQSQGRELAVWKTDGRFRGVSTDAPAAELDAVVDDWLDNPSSP